MPISQVLSRLGLWKYRQETYSCRRSNAVGLYLNETETEWIVFVAEEEPKAITREQAMRMESEWDRDFKHLHVCRIIFRGIQTELN